MFHQVMIINIEIGILFKTLSVDIFVFLIPFNDIGNIYALIVTFKKVLWRVSKICKACMW